MGLSHVAIAQGARTDTVSQFSISYPYPQVVLSLPSRYRFTPSDAGYDLRLHRSYATWSALPSAPTIASDSIRAGIEARGRAWFAQLEANAPGALHMEDAGRMSVVAGEDSVARRLFAERLAMPGLLPVERAYALLAAATIFADTTHPERLAVAETYMTALDHITDKSSGLYVYRAHLAMALAYSNAGQDAPALRHALQALGIVGRLPMSERAVAYNFSEPYMTAVHVLRSSPNGRQRLDTLNAAMRAGLQPFSGMTAADSLAMVEIPFLTDSLNRMIGLSGFLGSAAPAIRAHTWVNTRRQMLTQPMSLNDGVVRLVLFGNVYCCTDAMLVLQRLQAAFPSGASALLVTAIAGYVNGQLVSPADEISALQTVYANDLHLTYPIAIWGAPKIRTKAGGFVPEPSPNSAAYFVSRTFEGHEPTSPFADPYVAIIDGHGIVQHVFISGFTRDDQQHALTMIHELVARK